MKPPNLSKLIIEWKETQNALRQRLLVAPIKSIPRFVAGADAAFSRDRKHVFAAAVVYDRHDQRIVEVAHARREVPCPYIPGFLSFREGPAVLEAIGKLKHDWSVICFDGHGYAHPRRCGLASHMSILLDRPGIGVAKSRFIGTFKEPASAAGATSDLMEDGERIGLVLRTKDNVAPLFVSIGHRVDLGSARQIVLACCTKFRVPEPTRQADMEVAKLKSQSGAISG